MSVRIVNFRGAVLVGLMAAFAALPSVARAETKSFTVTFSDGSECTATASSGSTPLFGVSTSITSDGWTDCTLAASSPALTFHRLYDPGYSNIVVVSRTDSPSSSGSVNCGSSTSCSQTSRATVVPSSLSPPTVGRRFQLGWPRSTTAAPTPTQVVGPVSSCSFSSKSVSCVLTTNV